MNYYEIGNQCLDKCDFRKAIENYLKELESTPSNIEVLLKLSQAYYELGKYNSALDAIEVILNQDAENMVALTYRGYCYQELRMFAHAEKVFTLLIDLYPAAPENYLNRAKARSYLGNNEDFKKDMAKGEFLKSFDLNPIYSLDAIERPLDLDMQELERAQKSFLDEVVKDSNNFKAYYDLGVAFDKILAYKSACIAYSKAISLKKDGLFDKALFKRANSYFNNKDYKEALNDIEVYLEYLPQNHILSELKRIIIMKHLK